MPHITTMEQARKFALDLAKTLQDASETGASLSADDWFDLADDAEALQHYCNSRGEQLEGDER